MLESQPQDFLQVLLMRSFCLDRMGSPFDAAKDAERALDEEKGHKVGTLLSRFSKGIEILFLYRSLADSSLMPWPSYLP